jgi:hypothetical protein
MSLNLETRIGHMEGSKQEGDRIKEKERGTVEKSG